MELPGTLWTSWSHAGRCMVPRLFAAVAIVALDLCHIDHLSTQSYSSSDWYQHPGGVAIGIMG